jgi:hypothetical protein
MSFWSWLTGGSAVAEPIEAVGNVVDALFTSDEERLDKELIRTRLLQKPALVQAEINKVQAQHRSTFVAGARPSILWVCSLGLFFSFLVNPVLQWVTGEAGPNLPMDTMMELVLAMLGLSGLRTVEKIKGVAK